MKKLFILALFTLAVLTACAPVSQKFVDLPVEQEAAITFIVVSVIALLFNFAIARFPILAFLREHQEAWSLSLAVLAVRGIEEALPTGSDTISIAAVGLALSVVVYLLGRAALKRRGLLG